MHDMIDRYKSTQFLPLSLPSGHVRIHVFSNSVEHVCRMPGYVKGVDAIVEDGEATSAMGERGVRDDRGTGGGTLRSWLNTVTLRTSASLLSSRCCLCCDSKWSWVLAWRANEVASSTKALTTSSMLLA